MNSMKGISLLQILKKMLAFDDCQKRPICIKYCCSEVKPDDSHM